MPFANVERVPGGYVVSRLFTNQAAAQRGMDLLLGVNEQAFEPVRAYDAHPFDPVAAEEGDVVHLHGMDGTTRSFRIASPNWTTEFCEALKGVIPGSARLDGQPLNLPSDADGS